MFKRSVQIVSIARATIRAIIMVKRRFLTAGNFEGGEGRKILVLNAGSSSVKYGVYVIPTKTFASPWPTQNVNLLAYGSIENIGAANKPLSIDHQSIGRPGIRVDEEGGVHDHKEAFEKAFQLLIDARSGVMSSLEDISIVGHRVIHGGELSKAMVIDDKVLNCIQESVQLAPLHNPANLLGIEIAKQELPKAKHVAVFDTAFHQTIPPESFTYGIPREMASKHGIRRYGFHGISYQYLLQEIACDLCASEAKLNLIICHLGNGASMACIEGGRCVDTTMGMTPLEGLVMGTRCGDLDPGVVLYLSSHLKMSTEAIERLLNRESGLKGLCGLRDMRDVEQGVQDGNEDAILAEKIFVERVRKYLGSFLVRLKGEVHAIVFTGGIGENSARIRSFVCEGLHRFGISLDETKNSSTSNARREVSAVHSFCKVYIIPANEQLMIAMQALNAISTPKKSQAIPLHEQSARILARSEEQMLKEGFGKIAYSEPRVPGIILASHNADDLTDPAVAEVGTMFTITQHIGRTGYFRLFADDCHDRRIHLMKDTFDIENQDEDLYGVSYREAKKLLSEDKEDILIQKVVAKFMSYQKNHSFVLVGGLETKPAQFPTHLPAILNNKLASALNLPIIWATNVAASRVPGETDEALIQRIVKAGVFIKPKGDLQHVKMEGLILTDVPNLVLQKQIHPVTDALHQENIKLIAAIPSHSKFQVRTIGDIAESVGAKFLFSKSINTTKFDNTHVGDIIIATLGVDRLLETICQRTTNLDRIVSTSVSPALEQELRKEFAKFDRAEKGRIHIEEIGKVLAAIGYHPSERWLRATVDELGRSGKGQASVDFDTLVQLIMHRKESDVTESRGPLIVTNVGRPDVLMSLLLASKSSSFPLIAGILLTGAPDESSLGPKLEEILHGLDIVGVPVLGVALDTFSSVWRLLGPHGLHPPRLGPHCNMKLHLVSDLFSKSACSDFFGRFFNTRAVDDSFSDMTSHIFKYHIRKRAGARKQRIVLPEGGDRRVVCAAADLLAQGACYVIMLGNPDEILSLARQLRVSLDGISIINPSEAPDLQDMARTLASVRKSKGMTEGLALSLLRQDYTWYGTMMMYMDKADGMVSGACHSTADTLRPALQVEPNLGKMTVQKYRLQYSCNLAGIDCYMKQIIKTQPEIKLASSIFFMLLQDKVYIFGDCAINVEPTSEELAQIAVASAQSAKTFGIEPRVAMISYATGSSNTGPLIEKVRQATNILKEIQPELKVEGPIQFDAAVDPNIAKIKGVQGQVGGRANVCIFPDLNTGNTTYKAVQQATKCLAIGPIVQGLKKPVNDLSRGCTVKDVVNTVLITCLQAQASSRAAQAPL